ncbi:MAG: 16S rRNA (guanine(527)-N(7))-methyltransferase RsmG [Nitrospira sp.]|nr:16S rRNA (guanine(527)-N(7))-methyltransferase RsmG [Nitrospira sp.]
MEQRIDIQSVLSISASSIGISLTADQISKFTIYLEQLKEWNKTTNLTSIVDDEEIVVKHFVDSIAAIRAESFMTGGLVFDIGTGAGFPGIPIKILRPDLRFVLIEPSKKKSSFLRYITGILRLKDVDIFEGSMEKFANSFTGREQANYIVARGIKFEFIIDLSKTILSKNGRILLFLSTFVDRSRTGSNAVVENEYSFDLPIGYGTRVITSISISS